MKKVPEFKNEDEEFEFWSSRGEGVDHISSLSKMNSGPGQPCKRSLIADNANSMPAPSNRVDSARVPSA